jgi:hypothetical protein
MKKLYFVSVLAIASLTAGAQCTINQSVFSGPNDYGIYPDTVVNLPAAIVGVGYTTDLQFHVIPDTTVSSPVPGTYTINHVKIDSIVGMPANFTYSTNPASGIFPGGSYGCAAVSGLATAGQELGGPNADGIYPIIIHLTAEVNFFNVPTPMSFTQTGYRVAIQSANNVASITGINFSVANNAPNPADKQTDFTFTNPNNGNVQFTLYNILGETVKQTNINAVKGENRFTLNTAELPAGVYLYTFRSGASVVTRRMTVSH